MTICFNLHDIGVQFFGLFVVLTELESLSVGKIVLFFLFHSEQPEIAICVNNMLRARQFSYREENRRKKNEPDCPGGGGKRERDASRYLQLVCLRTFIKNYYESRPPGT